MTDARVTYYAAGILEWVTSTRTYNFTSDEPSQWRLEDSENDPYGQEGHYLPDPTLLSLAYDLLVEIGAVDRVSDLYGPEMFTVNDANVLNEMGNRFPGTPFEYTSRFHSKWITRALDKINVELKNGASVPQPQGEDEWEPLQIDRSDPHIEEAIGGIEAAIDQIRGDNGFATAYPAVRDSMVAEADAAIASVKQGQATRGQVWRALVSAGRWIAEKFTGSAIGAVGTELVKWALRLLGVPI